MKRRYAAGAALALIMAAPGSYASADPRHDGAVIAYTSDRDTPADATEFVDEVYLLDPQTRAVQRMTYDRPGVERWPTVSPDGRSLAWVRFIFDDSGPRQDLSEIYRCDLRCRAGSWSCHRPRKIVGPVQDNGITWTPDSRTILYSGPITTDDLDADIYAVDVRSRKTTNLTREAVADGIQVQNSQPTVSPDGRFFVYSRGSTGPTRADMYRRNIDGTHPVQLTAAPGNDIAADYSPDGKRLAFHGTRDGDADIYTMNAAVEGPDNPAVNLTNDLQSPPNVTHQSQERTPSFSPDGKRIAFWWFADPNTGFPFGFADGEIYSMRTDGSRIRNLTDNNPTDPEALTRGDIHPDWGPSPTRGRHH